MKCKILIIIMLLFASTALMGQTNDSFIENDSLRMSIDRKMDAARHPELSERDQMYSYILAIDEILKNCNDYLTYKSVYQYLIYGFSELGANGVVDYMMRVPYLENLGANSEQNNEIIAIANSFERVKIGQTAPDIHTVTIDKKVFDLKDVENKNVIILFWAESCPHCRDLIKELADFVKKNQDYTVVTVCVSKDLKKVKRLLWKAGLKKYYNICDGKGWSSQIIADYAVDMTPSMFVIGKDKKIMAKPFDIDDFNSIEP